MKRDKEVFRFKQFSVVHKESAMKVGTDGVLLGAWVAYSNPERILDIGTGSGVVALQMAQRFPDAHITGIEIDEKSAHEAAGNMRNSPWAERLRCLRQDIREYAGTANEKYDLILTNPPFFESDLPSRNVRLRQAKHHISLRFDELLDSIDNLLDDDGMFALIIPWDIRQKIMQLATQRNLFCRRELMIYPKASKNANRSILEFYRTKKDCIKENLYIYTEQNRYSAAYRNLCKEFYLNF